MTNPKAAKDRRRVVLDQMLQQGIIAADQYHAARSAALPAPDKVRLPGTHETQGQYFVNYVKQQLVSDPNYGAGAVFGGGLRIHTTLDLGLQKMARKAISKVLTEPQRPAGGARRDRPERPATVLAMVGGRTTTRASSTSRCRASVSRARRSSRSCSRRRSNEGISPSTHFVVEPGRRSRSATSSGR